MTDDRALAEPVDETPEAAYRLLHERSTGESPTRGGRALSAVQYDDARAAYLDERGIVARPGVAMWPPTSQTLRKRLGDGSWSQAMTTLGLAANTGRSRGTGAFTDDDYRSAIARFLTAAADDADSSVTSTSFAAYVAWAKEASAGTTTSSGKRPSGAAVRQHFGTWEAAKASAQQ